MPLDLFDRLIEEAPSARSIRLNGLGESTLLPNFASYLAVLERKGLATELISNGSGPAGSYARIFEYGGHVLVSWDAAAPATFEKLRRPAKWQAYRERLQEIGELALASQRGRLSLIFTLQKGNIGELPGVVELAASVHADGVQMNVAKLPGMSWVTSHWSAIARDVALASDMAERLGVILHIPDQVAGEPIASSRTAATAARGCRAPWQEVVIRWNGDVQVCNMFNPYTYGNVHRAPLNTIWRNQFASLFRSKLNGDDVHPYCRDCAYMASAYA
jgi:radical SAM protein with 4Fe4S-binding SPASM domain